MTRTITVIKSRRAKHKAWIRFKQSGNDPEKFGKYKEKQKKSQNLIKTANKYLNKN